MSKPTPINGGMLSASPQNHPSPIGQTTDTAIHDTVYGGDVRPQYTDMFKIMIKKTLKVNWKRWRIQTGCIYPTFHAGVNLALWILCDQLLEDGEWKKPIQLYVFRFFTPMCISMSMKVAINAMVTELVTEKESKMLIVQWITGVPAWLYWTAYLAYYLVVACFASLVWTIVLLASCLDGVNPLLVFVSMLLAYFHSFFTSAIFATIMNTSDQASHASGLILMVSLLPIFAMNLNEIPDIVIYIFGFLPNCSIIFWVNSTLMLKLGSVDWNWGENFNRDISTADWVQTDEEIQGLSSLPPPGNLFLLFFVHTFAWGAFAYWLNQVWQAAYGTARDPCFCFGCNRRRPALTQTVQDVDVEKGRSTLALEIKHLTKTFWRGGKEWMCGKGATLQKAVDDLSLDVRNGELFALLGHNGAGKTTAINCVSGMLPPSSGEVSIMGVSLATDPLACRWLLSVCPQDNPMYKELTVDEHLTFFSRLRGASDEKVEKEISEALKALGLSEKRMNYCGTLSGGQMRRLWVATSLIGKAPVVFLDEPTSGMDPSSRRELWNLLIGMKARGRSILFTTHYLEEADILADRKAVLAKGRCRAVGTSRELKMQFGTGYHLKALFPTDAPRSCLDDLGKLVKKHVAGSSEMQVQEVERAQGADAPQVAMFMLPFKEFDSFAPLFLAIEARSAEMKIQDFELEMTSLEDVFMALGKSKDGDHESDNAQLAHLSSRTASKEGLEFQKLEQESDFKDSVPMTKREFFKVIFDLRTTQMMIGKMKFSGLIFPPVFTAYGLMTSSGFFGSMNLLQGNFAMFPGFAVTMAGMRLLYTIVQERQKKITHVIISQGMPSDVYWLATASHSGLQMLWAGLLCVVPLIVFNQDNCISHGRILFIILSCFIMPVTASLYFYLFSKVFKEEESAAKTMTFINLFVAMFIFMLPNIQWNFAGEDERLDSPAMTFHTIISFVNPFYPVGGTMLGCWRAQHCISPSAHANSDKKPIGYERSDIPMLREKGFGYYAGRSEILTPIIGGIFQICAMGALAYYLNRAPGEKRQGVEEDTGPTKKDEDVLAEEARVKNIPAEQEACLYRDLHHTFYDKERTVQAVRGISLGIKKGECFGLLGPNGAGKTTTLNCLTGEIRPPTAGQVYVAGHSVTAEGVSKAYEHLGNCPQIDPLFPLLTGKQQLSFYGRMKGVPRHEIDSTVDGLLQRLGIEAADRTKPVQTYSGGMKRKLSLAISFIGRSDVLFLDEPSAAVDASAKRLLWQAIKLRSAKRTVILTTHSMEEAEACCDRIGIQVTGQLRCLGTALHLKGKYGTGYQLEVRLLKKSTGQSSKERADMLMKFMTTNLSPAVELLEAHEDCFLYQLPAFQTSGLSLGQIFTKLQDAKTQLNIEDYSLAQPTLEQVFLRFAREQAGATE